MHNDLTSSLSHVFWIGGATDAGKTTVADLLADRYGFQVYHYDHQEWNHIERMASTSEFHRRLIDNQVTMDELWVWPDPPELLQRAFRVMHARFPLAIDDLLAMSKQQPIIAEGFGFLPELIVPVIAQGCQAVWLVPTENFKWASAERRGKLDLTGEKGNSSDPALAVKNLMARDFLLAHYIREEASIRQLPLYETDGSRSAEALADEFARYFGFDKL